MLDKVSAAGGGGGGGGGNDIVKNVFGYYNVNLIVLPKILHL